MSKAKCTIHISKSSYLSIAGLQNNQQNAQNFNNRILSFRYKKCCFADLGFFNHQLVLIKKDYDNDKAPQNNFKMEFVFTDEMLDRLNNLYLNQSTLQYNILSHNCLFYIVEILDGDKKWQPGSHGDKMLSALKESGNFQGYNKLHFYLQWKLTNIFHAFFIAFHSIFVDFIATLDKLCNDFALDICDAFMKPSYFPI